jgi:hypothetical protein
MKQYQKPWVGYIKVKEAEALNPRIMTKAMGVELQMPIHAQPTMEKNEQLQKQIAVATKRVENCQTDEQRQCYSAALEKLESKLDKLADPMSE